MQTNTQSVNMTAVQIFLIILSIAVSGCNSSEAPHFLQSKEMQCLQSEAMSFKDPTSLKVVKNLGDRRGNVYPVDGKFWLLYAAKNGYGAYGTASMACKETKEGWGRDEHAQWMARLEVSNMVMERINAEYVVCAALSKNKNTESEAKMCRNKILEKYGKEDAILTNIDKIADDHINTAKRLNTLSGL